jgi:acyl carrier protein
MNEELFARFRKCAVDVLSVDADKVALEEEFNVEVPEDEIEGVKTVGQAYNLIVGKLS